MKGIMPSPRARRGSSGSVAGNGKLEPSSTSYSSSSSSSSSFSSARVRPGDGASRRRASSCSSAASLALSAGNGGGNGGSRRLSLSLLAVALKSLLAVDLRLSRRLGLCSGEGALLAVVRPLVRLVPLTAHELPWLIGTAYLLISSETEIQQEIMINLFIALLLDRALVGAVKAFFRHRRPEMFSSFPAHPRHRFPSGLITRAAMCARFLHAHLLANAPLRALVLLWAVLLGLSQVLLGRHNVTGAVAALAMGYWQYSLVERCWVSISWLQDVLLTVPGVNPET